MIEGVGCLCLSRPRYKAVSGAPEYFDPDSPYCFKLQICRYVLPGISLYSSSSMVVEG